MKMIKFKKFNKINLNLKIYLILTQIKFKKLNKYLIIQNLIVLINHKFQNNPLKYLKIKYDKLVIKINLNKKELIFKNI